MLSVHLVRLTWVVWKNIGYKLTHIKYIIDSVMRLHNFIIDYRLKHEISETTEMNDYEMDCMQYVCGHPGDFVGTFGDGINDTRGRPTNQEVKLRKMGEKIREDITRKLDQEGLHRPRQSKWRMTESSHIRLNE